MRLMPLSFAAICAFAPLLSHAAKGAPEMILPKLHAINLSEIEAGDLAARKACRADVKRFARIVARDHRALDVTVQRLSQQNRIQLNEVFVDEFERQNFLKQENDNRRLRRMEGCADRAFLVSMRDAHVFSYRVVNEALADAASAPMRRELLSTRANVLKHYNMSLNLLRDNAIAGKEEEQGKEEEGKEEQRQEEQNQQEEQKQDEQNQQDQGLISFIGKDSDEAKEEQKEEQQQEEQKQEEQNQQDQQDQSLLSFLGKEVDESKNDQKEEQQQEEQQQEEQNQQEQGLAIAR